MCLVDTDVVSELCKKGKANPRVIAFFKDTATCDLPLYLAAVTIGELRRGVELIRHRGDNRQAHLLEDYRGQAQFPRIVTPPSSTKIRGAPRAMVSAAMVAPNISTYRAADALGFSLMMWT